MNRFWRFLGVVFVLYSTIFLMKFLQRSFDEGDLRRGREALNRLQIHGQSVWPVMAQNLATSVDAVHCDELLVSRYSGPVRFECYAASDKSKIYIWNVDVVGFHVTPGNELSIALYGK